MFKSSILFRMWLMWAPCLFASCAYNDFPKFADCSQSNLELAVLSKQNPTACAAIDGRIVLTANGGESPYSYSLNGSGFQSLSSYSFLGPGTYVGIAQDANNCQSIIEVDLNSSASTLSAAAAVNPDSDCLSDNGSILITPVNGNAPYQYQFGNGTFGNLDSFTNLPSGVYTITVKDTDNCPYVVGVNVPRTSTGVSYSTDIVPIIKTNCAVSGCHDGSLGSSRDWRNYSNIKTNAQNIKTRTGNRTMPSGGLTLTQEQIQLIACWVDDGANNN